MKKQPYGSKNQHKDDIGQGEKVAQQQLGVVLAHWG